MIRSEKIKTYLESLPDPLQQQQQKLNSKLQQVVMINKKLDWDTIAGCQQAKTAIEEAAVLPLKFPQLFANGSGRKPWFSILLYGPPGTGKTLIAKTAANLIPSFTFHSFSASDIVTKSFGGGDKNLKECFEKAKQTRPAIIFFDEIDAICSHRTENSQDSNSEALNRIKTQFLIEMSKVEQEYSHPSQSILVISATNRPFDLDLAVLRRFQKKVFVPLPDSQTRGKLINIHCSSEGNNNNEMVHLSAQEITQLSNKTNGYSGADISNLCREALMQPVRDCINNRFWKYVHVYNENTKQNELKIVKNKNMEQSPDTFEEDLMKLSPDLLLIPSVDVKDFTKSLKTVKPSISRGDLTKLEEWTKKYGTPEETKEENSKLEQQNTEQPIKLEPREQSKINSQRNNTL